MSNSFYEPLVRPRSVAIVGASDDPTKISGRAQRYLRKHGYDGAIFPINPGRETVQGEAAFPSLSELPGPVDHAYVVLPTGAVERAVEQCAEAGIPVVSVLADGFAEDGPEGLVRQDRVRDAARAGGIRLLGPNSMAVINPVARTALSVNAALDMDNLLPGRLMAMSQSGSLVGTLISRGQARGIGFATLLSMGNEADLTIGDIGAEAVSDPNIDAFVLFLETIRRPDRMAEFAARAHAAGKPILVYMLGRSDAGRQLAVSHTGAIAGSDAAADAFLTAHGMVRVEQFESLLEAPALLIGRAPSATRGSKSVAVVTTTGGGGAMVVDRLGTVGVEVSGASDAVKARVSELGVTIRPGRLTDVTLAGAKPEIMSDVLGGLLDDPNMAAVVSVVGSSAQFHPDRAVKPMLAFAEHETPLAGFMVPNAEQSLRALSDAGIAGFRTAESCADAIRALMHWTPPDAPPETERLRLSVPARGQANERAALTLFGELDLPVVESVVLGPDQPLPDDLRYPVVAKVLSTDIPHKTEAGGVVLGIEDAEALETARRRILENAAAHAPGAKIEGILVQPMRKGVVEALIGLRRDPSVGAIVTLAAGGTLAEIYRDAAVRLAPVNLKTAREMIEEVRGLAIARGYRGLPKGDTEALARAVADFSRLARLAEGAVEEAEINPVIVLPEGEGVVAVDGLLRFAD